MKDRLYKRFLLSFLAFLILCLAISTVIGGGFIYRFAAEIKAKELKRISIKISNDMVFGNEDNIKLESFSRQLDTIAKYTESEIWIVDDKGEVIYTSNSQTFIGKNRLLKNIFPYKIGSYYGVGDFGKYFDTEKKLSVINTIVSQYKTIGYVILHYDYGNIIEQGNGITYIFIAIIIVIMLFALIIFGALSLSIIKPINRIIGAVKEYSSGNLGYVVAVNTNDEIGLLADALNDMSDSLKKTQEYQKQLLANVSHDFRSPLTSIKGYIEAILDGTIPDEMQEKYLNTVLRESKRLSSLTEEILELNRIDSGRFMLDIKPIEINGIIRDTARSFEGRCSKRNITIQLIFADENNYVLADSVKIQQVCYNLIDNAIKFSGNNSEIVVETTKNKDKLMVAVKDAGCGIASDELKKIWERFYKSDISRGRDKGSSGLGLSIVKEIIQQHKENINVVSTLDVGTTFIFTLKLIDDYE